MNGTKLSFRDNQSFFRNDKVATTRNVTPAQKRLPVKSHTARARSTAGINIRSKRTRIMIIIPITTRIAREIISN
jgi:hypothetical protein